MVQGDARQLPLADSTVDLVVTSPPYYSLRTYRDGDQVLDGQIGAETNVHEFVDSLLQVTSECARALRDSGSIFVNLGDKYSGYNANRGEGTMQGNAHRPRLARGTGLDVAGIPNKSLVGVPWRYALACVDRLGLIWRAEIVWEKTDGLGESVRDRVRRNHEVWLHFTKKDRYWADLNAVQSPDGRRPPSVRAARVARGKTGHPAPFPQAWPAWFIDGWCPPWVCQACGLPAPSGTGTGRVCRCDSPIPAAAVVLDPFVGSGTTLLAAQAAGRTGVGVDLSREYAEVARHRCSTAHNENRRSSGP